MQSFAKYIEKLFDCQFPQSYLLDSNDFMRFLRTMGFKINERDLEYYDEKGILRPAAVLKLKRIQNYFPKYETVFSDIFTMRDLYYKEGRLKIGDNRYVPWESNTDGYEQRIILYYHPYQFLPLHAYEMELQAKVKVYNLENENDAIERLKSLKTKMLRNLESCKKSYEEFWTPRIGLLILLDEAYGPLVKSFRGNINEGSNTYYNRWKQWRKKSFKPDELLKSSNFSLNDVKRFYETLAVEGQSLDPLENWFVFQRIIKKSWLLRLKNDAFRAQQYYKLSWMLYNFIYDLSGEKMYEPDDIMDANGHGVWKKGVYGKPFNYKTKKTQMGILDVFLINRPFRAGLIFEGDTEQTVIDSILNALGIDKKRSGLFLHNAEGVSNIGENMRAMYGLSSLENISLFVILDKDEKTEKIEKKIREFIKPNSIKIWKGDFEHHNFGMRRVVNEVNKEMKARNLQEIKLNQVSKKIKESYSLMRAIEIICGQQNRKNLYRLITKKILAQRLIKDRIIEIQKEKNSSNGWIPKLPIEKVLNKVFRTMPIKSFTYTDY